MKKVYYYTDELKDDFSKVKIKDRPLSDDYEYITKSKFRKFFDLLIYKLIATPLAFCYTKIVFHEKIVNKKCIKPYLNKGCYIYANHTRIAGDAFTPGIVTFPKKVFIITNNDSASNPIVRFFTKTLGSLPLPSSLKGFKNFTNAVYDRVNNGYPLLIYPEAHIWPYYTSIRPFKNNSFHYPVTQNKPVFVVTTTYQKQRIFNKPKTTIYVDGPIFIKEELNNKENQQYLRDTVYDIMMERSKNSTFKYTEFIKKDN